MSLPETQWNTQSHRQKHTQSKQWNTPPESSPPRKMAGEGSPWRLETFRGRLAELSGGAASAVLTLAFRLVLEAQRRGEPVAWVTDRRSSFFPPDTVESGVDLEALAVVRLPTVQLAPRAADLLVRSGGFGLVVLDLGRVLHLPIAVQTRLAALAKKHHAALLCLTEKPGDVSSLGSLVSVRVDAHRQRETENRFGCEVRVLKDKRRGTDWRHLEVCRAPAGLC